MSVFFGAFTQYKSRDLESSTKKSNVNGLLNFMNSGIFSLLVAEVSIFRSNELRPETISFISFSNPISRDLSNSSITRFLMLFMVIRPLLIWSATLPGVPTKIVGVCINSIFSFEPDLPP